MNNYVLDERGEPVPEPDLMAWARWFEQFDNRRVDRTEIGDVHVSTVFLATDHNWLESGPPILWETMIFGGDYDGHEWRWTTRAAAQAGHDRIVAALRAGEAPEGYGDDK